MPRLADNSKWQDQLQKLFLLKQAKPNPTTTKQGGIFLSAKRYRSDFILSFCIHQPILNPLPKLTVNEYYIFALISLVS